MIFVPMFLLAIVAFTVKVFVTASSAYEDKIERLCAPEEESNWAHVAPPMEKTNARIYREEREAHERACRESGRPRAYADRDSQ